MKRFRKIYSHGFLSKAILKIKEVKSCTQQTASKICFPFQKKTKWMILILYLIINYNSLQFSMAWIYCKLQTTYRQSWTYTMQYLFWAAVLSQWYSFLCPKFMKNLLLAPYHTEPASKSYWLNTHYIAISSYST